MPINEECEKFLVISKEYEHQGDINNALHYLNLALSKSESEFAPVLNKIIRLLFRSHLYTEGIELLLNYQQIVDNNTLELFEKIVIYNESNISKDNYLKNLQMLSTYDHKEGLIEKNYEELKYKVFNNESNNLLVYSNGNIVMINNEYTYDLADDILGNDNLHIFVNEVHMESLLLFIKNAKPELNDPSLLLPFYCYFDSFDYFSIFLQKHDITPLIKSNQIIFLIGITALNSWLEDYQTIIPNKIIYCNKYPDHAKEVMKTIEQAYNRRMSAKKEALDEIARYYDNIDVCSIKEKIAQKSCRIMFITSRFTTFLQYCTRDLNEACKELGYDTVVLIENSDLKRVTHEYLQVEINRFKPDIIFVLDHFRWEYPDVHSNVIFITWIQDVLPHLYDKRSVPKLQDLDFLLSIYIGYKEFDDVGYPYDKITYSPITVNDNIFKKYDISGSQKSHFGSDICYIANGGNPYEALDELKKIIIDDFSGLELIEDKLNEIFQILYDSCLNGDYTFTYERYKNIFTNVFGRYAMDIFPQYLLNSLLWFLRFKIEYSMHISSPLEWLHNEGYNIKLWGNSWNSHPVLNQHDMGVARHGEELSMIYNASKITLGLSPYISAHFRYFEATCSGCLYIGRDIPVEYDYSKMRMFFKEDKEILFFKKRDDLLKKVDYYLESHEKRKEIYDASIDKILNNFTYKSLMVNLLNEVSSRINNKVVI